MPPLPHPENAPKGIALERPGSEEDLLHKVQFGGKIRDRNDKKMFFGSEEEKERVHLALCSLHGGKERGGQRTPFITRLGNFALLRRRGSWGRR